MDRKLAAHCAWLCEISYCKSDFIDTFFDAPPVHFSNKGTDGFVSSSQWGTIVTFRGTQVTEDWSWEDIFTNFKMRMGHWHGGGRAHGGYMRALDNVWIELIPILNSSPRPFIYTGHSLGGALATLASTIPPYPSEVYTFGAPRVGDSELMRTVDWASFYRIVNGIDLAPRFPSWIRGYRHPPHTRWHLVGKRLYRDPIGFFDKIKIPGLFVLGTLAHRIGQYRKNLR